MITSYTTLNARAKWIRDERLKNKIREKRGSKKSSNIDSIEADDADDDHEAEIEAEHIAYYDCLLGGGAFERDSSVLNIITSVGSMA